MQRYSLGAGLAILALLLAACTAQAPAPLATASAEPVRIVATAPVPTAPVPTATPDPMRLLRGKKIAALFSGPIDDAGWTAAAYQGLVALRDKWGLEIAYTENVPAADQEQLLRGYAEAGHDIVFAHGFEYADAIVKVARAFPNTQFIETNGVEANVPNLYTVAFSAGEGGYFIGLAACLISQTHKVAYVAGASYPIFDHQIRMSRQACADLGVAAEVAESYVDSWYDPARARELATAAIENGVDVLILNAEGSDTGALTAAAEANAAGGNVKVLSWGADKHDLAPEIVIGGWEESIPRLIEYCIEQIARGEPGGYFVLGLRERAAGLLTFHDPVPPAVVQQVVDTLNNYLADPASLPTLEVRTDL